MSPYRNRLKTPEEVELGRKRSLLKRLQTELDRDERRFMALKAEIRMFEQCYEEVLGVRIAELEDLEWQLKGILGVESLHQSRTYASEEFSCAEPHHTTDLLDDPPLTKGEVKSLKSLYRDVAKAVHPDLAPDSTEKRRRQELMAVANQAYQAGDRKALEDILCDWELSAEPSQELSAVEELIRVIRLIARVKENIHAVRRQIDELKNSDIYRFKIRVDDATANGSDLLSEMAATVDADIVRTRKRLFILRGESVVDVEQQIAPETRIISFPEFHSCGALYVRSASSADYRDWRRFGNALGVREVFLDKSVRLDVRGSSELEMRFLDGLAPDDIQSLFLYNIDDSALNHVARLIGLQELYISNAHISDDGIRLLTPLVRLQRLSIYHTPVSDNGLWNLVTLRGLKWLTCSGTSITEEGLALYRRHVPGCKAVSFKWRYEV